MRSALHRSLGAYMPSSRSAAGPSSLPRCSSPSSSSSQTHNPANYRAQRNEVGVFTTLPYSTAIKPFWRYKDEIVAKKSAEEIWEIFERYGEMRDFVGMDIARKFIQMGRTRSLRYALRKGGKKYQQATEKTKLGPDKEGGATYQVKRATGERLRVIPRTGEVFDKGKLKGAEIFRSYEDKCWEHEVYVELWDAWKAKQGTESKVKTKVEHEGDASNGLKDEPGEPGLGKPKRTRQELVRAMSLRHSKRQR